MAKAMGTMQQGDTFRVTVRHGERESYSRACIPAAKRNLKRLYPFNLFELEFSDLDNARPVEPGVYETDWIFRRIA